MNRAEQLLADGSLRKGQQHSLIRRRRRALRGRIEFAEGLNFIAEKLDAKWPVSFGRVNIKNAAAKGVFAGHLNHVSRVVADGIEMLNQ